MKNSEKFRVTRFTGLGSNIFSYVPILKIDCVDLYATKPEQIT